MTLEAGRKYASDFVSSLQNIAVNQLARHQFPEGPDCQIQRRRNSDRFWHTQISSWWTIPIKLMKPWNTHWFHAHSNLILIGQMNRFSELAVSAVSRFLHPCTWQNFKLREPIDKNLGKNAVHTLKTVNRFDQKLWSMPPPQVQRNKNHQTQRPCRQLSHKRRKRFGRKRTESRVLASSFEAPQGPVASWRCLFPS